MLQKTLTVMLDSLNRSIKKQPLATLGAGGALLTVGGIALAVRRSHQRPEYRLRKSWQQTLKTLDGGVADSMAALETSIRKARKYWKQHGV